MAFGTVDISNLLGSEKHLSLRQRVKLVAVLSWPAIMAQLSSIMMSYIDASMVGRLGASASASIGLVSTTSWLFWGLGAALSTGYSVQVAHLVGASKDSDARSVFFQSLVSISLLGCILGLFGMLISPYLPIWLRGNAEINADATSYFFIVTASMPFCFICYLSSGMLRCAGNMLVPGLMNVVMCVLDVVFNYFMIFDEHVICNNHVPGFGLGVKGAALGTALSEVVTGIFLLIFILRKSRLKATIREIKIRISKSTTVKALKISAPIAAERIMMCGAQIITTIIVAPLGTAAIAANAFGIVAESLCYMPGYGVSDAATTLVGQSIGANRKDLARSFGKITISLGIAVMTFMGILMWLGAPLMMNILTPDQIVRGLGVGALRIEAFAEPMFAASIVAYGVMIGAGYTFVPACINLASIWFVRLTLAAVLAPFMGLSGVWLAMCIELCVRGIAFLLTFKRYRWLNKNTVVA